ncbi:DEAD/DEAH box helicase [bacterium]|nr:DEAD/DEAH box helicase [bacterium]
MLPTILSRQIRQGIGDFLETTFPVTTAHFAHVISDFVHRDEEIFRGPFLSIRLPFEQGDARTYFPDIPMGFPPYRHQQRAFERLGGLHPRSTLIATGTGSGKTESFLFPVLDYCLQMRRQGVPGIKAILIYPMNALATDQSRRIARIIHGNDKLRQHLRAGLYVGQQGETPVGVMTPDSVVTDREVLRGDPPDILLTNYKMLDYLLLRPRDARLWTLNGPETLRFLVVDELHTFDGAQGTDLACLLRRMKSRLGTPERHLCCVGTSATLGSEQNSDALRDYAARVFGEEFDTDAVITESTVPALDFLGLKQLPSAPELPEKADLLLQDNEPPVAYLLRQAAVWTSTPGSEWRSDDASWRTRLAEELRKVPLFQYLLSRLDGRPRDMHALYSTFAADMQKLHTHGGENMQKLHNPVGEDMQKLHDVRVPEFEHLAAAVESLAACVSAARDGDGGPWLHVRQQLWFRELRRLVCTVGERPELRLSDELTKEHLDQALPLLHCRECGATAWGAVLPDVERKVRKGLQEFYSRYFAQSLDVAFLFPESNARALRHEQWHLCPDCLAVDKQPAQECRNCGSDTDPIPVLIWRKARTLRNRTIGVHDCPYCEGTDSMTIVGSRAASLISVVNAQLFASPFNEDKKLLAFSDSVQDASHRAGFFTARTYRFNMRTALQQFVQSLERPLTLEEFPRAFIRSWRQSHSMDEFLATFIPPDMEWMEDWEYYRNEGRLPEGSALLNMIEQRIQWEIFAEYGFSSRIGRTLEKSASSVAGPDLEALTRTLDTLHTQLREQYGVLREVQRADVVRFLLGMLTQMKIRGALYQQDLAHYISQGGNTWLLNDAHHLPNFGPSSRAPAFLIDGKNDRFDVLVARTGRKSWYEDWAIKCFAGTDELFESWLPDMLRDTVALLEKYELLLPFDTKGGNAWALQPTAFRVGTGVLQLRCASCGHAQSVPDAQRDTWIESPCMRYSCRGRYAEDHRGGGYYASLYGEGDVRRLVSREHTGLLESGERKLVEERFMQGTKPWDPNLLSCTPTLEMGVDIGDLSTVVLCSVPPSQSSYVQRIGRAGRRDGNALNITVAAAKPHDQYFFAEPDAMISGAIQPPGCFLGAPAVLERQFTAYCFDRWVLDGADEHDIPSTLGPVLTSLNKKDEARFPWSFFHFAEEKRDMLFADFRAMFARELDSSTEQYLRRYVYGDGAELGDMRYRIEHSLHLQQKEVRDMDNRVKGLEKQLKELADDPAAGEQRDVLMHELLTEKQGLLAILKDIRSKHILEFLTDEGFLPNYAFPEAGIMLRSVIYRHAMSGSVEGQKMSTWHYEYERPAAAAIKELAPSSSFYAGGRRVVVDQVNLRLSEPEDWRFCPACTYAEREEQGNATGGCPHCGTHGWKDAKQKRRLLRLRQVLATTSDRESRSWDEHDDRSPTFYERDTLVQPDPASISSAWAIENEEVPFGFEYVGSARFVDINFGEENQEGEHVRIAGREVARPGFLVCRECGRVQNERNRRKHTRSCRYRDKDDASKFAEMLYLYREFSTEAIRMLLPATSLLASSKLEHSFVAALLLGLRSRFQGNIDHLQTTVMQEPMPQTAVMKKYLVLYDVVPGGTGYLKELLQNTDVLRDVFTRALNHLRECSCRKEGKDGCYSCLYAYRLSYHMADISREAAEDILESILGAWESLHEVKSIDEISVFPLLESELERYFVNMLFAARPAGKPVSRTRRFIHGMDGYRMRIGTREYGLVFQQSLGAAEQVAIPSRADFVIYPLDENAPIKPVVVFTDGFEYHAMKSNGPGRVGTDLNQRMALLRSGRYHVWSITWDDLERYEKQEETPACPFLTTEDDMLGRLLGQSSVPEAQTKLRGSENKNSLVMLLEFLASGTEADYRAYMLRFALAGIKGRDFRSAPGVQLRRKELWLAESTDTLTVPAVLPSGDVLFSEMDIPLLGHRAGVISRSIPMQATQSGDYEKLQLLLRFGDAPDYSDDPPYRQMWNSMLHAVNLWQFLPNFAMIADSGMKDAKEEWLSDVIPEESMPDAEWEIPPEEILTEEEAQAVRGLEASGLGVGVLMHELASDGKVVAQSIAAWPDALVALVADDAAAKQYASSGWKSLTAAIWKEHLKETK